MDNRILHEEIPGSVRALDLLINRRIVEARGDDAEVDHWLHVKVDVKRRVVADLCVEQIAWPSSRAKALLCRLIAALSRRCWPTAGQFIRWIWPGFRHA